MSYQPQPPTGGGTPPPGYQQPGYQQPGYQQPAYPQPGYQQPGYTQPGYTQPQHLGVPPAATPPARSGTALRTIGLVVGVVGLLAGVAMFLLSGSAEEETVEKFARAPAGCTTTLEFDTRSTFTLYLETKGSIELADGDCAANGSSYSRTDDDLPQLTLRLVDSADQEVALTAVDGPSYDAGGFAGRGVQRVEITAPGTYQLTVDSADSNFAIAVGGAPDADSVTMKNTGIVVAVIGVLLAALLLFLAARTQRATLATPGPAPWQPGPGGGVPGAQPQSAQPHQHAPQQPPYQQPYQQPQPTYQQPPQPPRPPDQGWGAPKP